MKTKFLKRHLSFLVLPLLFFCCQSASAAIWSTTEAQYQYGKLDAPTFAGGGSDWTHILTLQHASGWKYGDNFFFFDILNSGNSEFNDNDIYMEWYSNFSIGKLTGANLKFGPVKDLGIILGINMDSQAKVIKYLPGIRFDLDLPKFAFAHLDVTAYLDGNKGVEDACALVAPTETDSFMVDFNWALPISVGNQLFSIEGHVEYIDDRTNSFGGDVDWWILGQPQFRWDIGNALFNHKDTMFVGAEIQFWINKLGDSKTDEFAPQALAVWRF